METKIHLGNVSVSIIISPGQGKRQAIHDTSIKDKNEKHTASFLFFVLKSHVVQHAWSPWSLISLYGTETLPVFL